MEGEGSIQKTSSVVGWLPLKGLRLVSPFRLEVCSDPSHLEANSCIRFSHTIATKPARLLFAISCETSNSGQHVKGRAKVHGPSKEPPFSQPSIQFKLQEGNYTLLVSIAVLVVPYSHRRRLAT